MHNNTLRYRIIIIILTLSFLSVFNKIIYVEWHSNKTKDDTIIELGETQCNKAKPMFGCEQPLWNCLIDRDKLDLWIDIEQNSYRNITIAEAYDLYGSGSKKLVVVKSTKSVRTNESEQMKRIGKHKNIINLVGYCSQTSPSIIVLEYAAFGNLGNFLNYMLPYDPKNNVQIISLLTYALQIARGMRYIASRGFIHRDLSSRNILVTKDLTMKIADFSSALHINDKNYSSTIVNRINMDNWMPIESLLNHIYDTKSEIWAYGVLLWEIMHFANITETAGELPNTIKLKYIKNGKRLPKPGLCPSEIYALMINCWNVQRKLRPTFTEIVNTIDKVLREKKAEDNQ